jgi:hypothetical protein
MGPSMKGGAETVIFVEMKKLLSSDAYLVYHFLKPSIFVSKSG